MDPLQPEQIPAPVVLASASPRRRMLLSRAGIDFEVHPADICEEVRAGETPIALVKRLAREKALAVANRLGATPCCWVIGADTVVVIGKEILGKPRDADHALALLSRLVGRKHSVITGIAVADSAYLDAHTDAVESRVQMRPAGQDELRRYVATGEPFDKAGAYALQGEGRRFVQAVEGSESNVIGLPIEETLALLHSAWQAPARTP